MSPAFSLKWKQAPSVRASLVALVVACILPVASVAAVLIVSFYRNEQAQLISNTVSRARTIITAVDHDFDSTEVALRALGTARVLISGDMQGFHARAVDMLGNLHADSILLLGSDGKMLLSTRLPYGAPLAAPAATPLLRRILASGRPGVSDLFSGPLNGTLIYAVGVPVWRHGRLVMTLDATATPAQMAHVLAEQRLPASWRSSVVDNSGRVVARSHESDKYAGQRISDDLLRRIAAADEGGFETRSLDGIDVFVVFSRSPTSRWTALLGIPIRELNAGLHATMATLVAATLAALAIGLAMAWLIGGRIARSVHALIGPALALGGGAGATIPPL